MNNVIELNRMFKNLSFYNYSISDWKFENLEEFQGVFSNTSLKCNEIIANYYLFNSLVNDDRYISVFTSSSLVLLDVRVPFAPYIIEVFPLSSLDIGSGLIKSITSVDDYIIYSSNNGKIGFINWTDRYSPTVLSSFELGSGQFYDIGSNAKDMIFVGATTGNLFYAVNISNITNPNLMNTIEFNSFVTGVDYFNKSVYVSTFDGFIHEIVLNNLSNEWEVLYSYSTVTQPNRNKILNTLNNQTLLYVPRYAQREFEIFEILSDGQLESRFLGATNENLDIYTRPQIYENYLFTSQGQKILKLDVSNLGFISEQIYLNFSEFSNIGSSPRISIINPNFSSEYLFFISSSIIQGEASSQRILDSFKISNISDDLNCYSFSNIGTIGLEEPCLNKLIINEEMLRNAIEIDNGTDRKIIFQNENYTFGDSNNNIFTGQVKNMSDLFRDSNFNSSINYWDVSSVNNMSALFKNATLFNQDLNNWNTSSLVDLTSTFESSINFNSDISTWDVSNVESFDNTFRLSVFNSTIENWNTSNVRSMFRTFAGNLNFNQPLSNWDVSNVVNMENLFRSSSFNQPLYNWDVSNVINMDRMFRANSAFNNDLRCWNVTNIENTPSGFNAFGNLNSSYYPIWGSDGSDCFISTWNTSLGDNQSSITLPLVETGNYNFTISWGDGNTSLITQWNQSEATYNYSIHGKYTLIILGIIEGFSFNNGGDVEKIVDISQWGNLSFGDTTSHFYGTSNLDISATDAPNLSETTSLQNTFRESGIGETDFSKWNTSSITSMHSLFQDASNFNGNVENWNTSNVTSMNSLFRGATNFNRNISSWDTSNVLTFARLFQDAISFNQSLNNWNISNVRSLYVTFSRANSFNQPLDNWDVSNVENLAFIFHQNGVFNQSLNNWNTSSLIRTEWAFNEAQSFNQPLDNWNTSGIRRMDRMFSYAINFDQPLNEWNITRVTTLGHWNGMENMFRGINISQENLDITLDSWSQQDVNNNIPLHIGSGNVSSIGLNAIQVLENDFNWIITSD